jgi:hypothetical protein
MHIEKRLEALRSALLVNWRELAERLAISERSLHYIRLSARNPSPKLMRRISDLEQEAGLSKPSASSMAVGESAGEYHVGAGKKAVNMLELLQDVKRIEEQVHTLRTKIEEAINED